MISRLDVRERKGTYLVQTESGTRYLIQAGAKKSGQIEVMSDGLVIPDFEITLAIVGGAYNCVCKPIIEVGQSMHLVVRGNHRATTSRVVKIED